MAQKTIAVNRKAYHDYHIEESIEAGLVLTGTEIKSIRAGGVNLRDAYARSEKGELWLLGAHIAQYPGGNRYNHEPKRPRKLLLHRRQIAELSGAVMRKGLTIVPLKLYLKKGMAKVELGLVRGKKVYDKREALALRDAQRQIERAFSQRTPDEGKKR
ncbi:MAG: SsrA-binding protein SmpB [Dehalococcoidia bacterium]|nr:MAG: SsrA-binding protein SmpB [Dehalococcoidia bacterium]